MTFFASINFGHNSPTKASTLKVYNYFRGRKKKPNQQIKKQKAKQKFFFQENEDFLKTK